MKIEILETPTLGNRGYLIHDGEVGIAVDVQRDYARWTDAATAAGVKITHVFETHMHNDYVTGGYRLAQELDAEYIVPAGSNQSFTATLARDQLIFDIGSLSVTAIHTPGHTQTHMSYAITDSTQSVVCTGGSLLYGTVGRTDLISKDLAKSLTSSQYDSAQKLKNSLPSSTEVYPTHGFGSFCSSSEGSGATKSTLADEATTNVAFTHDKASFIHIVLDGLGPYPRYYAHMDGINREGPSEVKQLHIHDYATNDISEALQADDTWVVDIRSRKAFAASHPELALGIELGGSFATYTGWLVPWADNIILVGDSELAIREGYEELSRIGMDLFVSGATHDLEPYMAAAPLRSYTIQTFTDLKSLRHDKKMPYVLDVRLASDWEKVHINGSYNVPLHELRENIDLLPQDQPIWVHCASGYRASIAASLIDRSGRTPVLIDDSFDTAASLQLTDDA